MITLTENAAVRVKTMLAKEEGARGLKVGLKKTGCSGYSYTLEFVKDPCMLCMYTVSNGVTLFIDQKDRKVLDGTVVDYVVEKFGGHFAFNNPQEKARCGCGESFSV